MKKQYHLLSILALFSVGTFAQHTAKHETDIPYQKTLKLDNPVSKVSAMSQFAKMYNLKEGNTYQTIRTTTDVSGMSHERVQQYFNGIKVEFGTLILHAMNGAVVSVNGELYDASQSNLKASVTSDEGLVHAINSVGAQKYLWQDVAQASIMEYTKPKGELVLFPDVITGKVSLAYKYDIYATAPISREDIYVDANSGEILFKNAIIKHATGLIPEQQKRAYTDKIEKVILGMSSALITGNAATRYSGNRSIETSQTGPSAFVLNDITRGGGIVTYNCQRSGYSNTNFTDNDNNWTAAEFANANKDNAGLDAHWGAEMTYDFFKNIFNRDSFDDKGAQIRSYVHADLPTINAGYPDNDNAFWNGSVMTYGDGGTTFNNPLSSIDVCGHEIGHAVCQYTAGLVYSNQSGALNEGFSDIWGTCIEQYGRFGNLNIAPDSGTSPGTSDAWRIGEDITASGYLRSMSYPRTRSQPDTYLGTSWFTGTTDNGGVHYNSGVLNHWFYIVTAGKAGTNNASAANGGPDNYNVTGIGMAKAAQIAYYTERDYLTANSNYTDARNASITAASSLYCATSPEVQSVTNAWYAVNLGEAYVSLAVDVVNKNLTGNTNLGCGVVSTPVVTLENGGTNAITAATITYNIDAGTNSVINWTGNLTNCSQANQNITISPAPTRGFHKLNVTTTTTGDGNATNNTKSIPFIINDSGIVGTVNPFTSAVNNLVAVDASGTTSTVWERGTINKAPLSGIATGNSAGYATKLIGNYPDKTTSYLVSQCYNLSNYTNTRVSFDMAFDLESNWDILYFEYSTDNGANWNVLGTSADPTWYNSPRMPDPSNTNEACLNCIGKQWTGLYSTAPTGGNGQNGNKRTYSHELASLGTPANAIFRFTFVSDDSSNNKGVFIDNFVIQGTLGIEENKFEQFAVYPNPSNGKFNIVLSTTDKVNVQLFDLRGRSVFTKLYNATGISFNQQIDLSSLSSGVYILNVESNGKKEAKRIIIE